MLTPNEYTTVPPTSDLNYWQAKPTGGGHSRCISFTPKDPELHRKLMAIAWKKIQAKLPPNLRSRQGYAGG